MTMLSLKEVETNYGRKELSEQISSWMIRFSHSVNLEQRKYGIFFRLEIKMAVHAARKNKKIRSEQLLILF